MKFNLKVIGNIIGILLLINGLLMLSAVPFGIYHGESSWKGILVASLVNSIIGFIFYYNTKDNENKELKRRDGYLNSYSKLDSNVFIWYAPIYFHGSNIKCA